MSLDFLSPSPPQIAPPPPPAPIIEDAEEDVEQLARQRRVIQQQRVGFSQLVRRSAGSGLRIPEPSVVGSPGLEIPRTI